jgi:predicted acyltransferase
VTTSSSASSRLDSLDAFRGLTIAAMILVSTPGTWDAVYWPLDHALWNGWTLADLVFPFLLFAMGAAVPVALARRRRTPKHLWRHVIRRALVLFGLGLALNALDPSAQFGVSTFRILGVLQRIAIVYVVVAWLTERTSPRTQAIVAAVALLGYWAAMTLISVPGVGPGLLTPNGNLAAYIDRVLLGRHLVHMTWDSEGLLSTIPAVVTSLIGVLTGRWLMRSPRPPHESVWLFVAGLGIAAIGLLWDRTFPINKNLWTSSFVMLSGGLAVAVLALCHWLLDVRRWRRWSVPFAALGRNALAVYVLSVAVDNLMTRWDLSPRGASIKWQVYWYGFGSWLATCCRVETASLAYALAYTALWAAVATVAYRRHVFIGI